MDWSGLSRNITYSLTITPESRLVRRGEYEQLIPVFAFSEVLFIDSVIAGLSNGVIWVPNSPTISMRRCQAPVRLAHI